MSSARRALGIVVVGNDPVPEAELWRQVGPHADIITTRFPLARAPGQEYRGQALQEFLTPEITQGVDWLVDAGADAIALCFVSVSVFTDDFDASFSAWVHQRHHRPGYTAAAAVRAQLDQLEAAHPLMVAPPWFTDTTITQCRRYLAGPQRQWDTHRFQLPKTWQSTTRQDLFDQGAKTHIAPQQLLDQIRARVGAHTDAVVMPGSGFATLDASRLGSDLPPVITANSAVAHHFLNRTRLAA